MNYMKEIIAFEQWLETHYLPISAQLLWYKLMAICNRAGWSEWVTVDNLRLMAAMQMSREATLIKTRDELIKAGLVEYQKGKKGSPNKYKMISLVATCTFKNVVQNEVESEVERVVENEVKGVVESVDIYKHKQNKNKTKKRSTKVLPEKFCESEPLNNAILAFLAHRKSMKAPMTEHAIELMLKKLNKMTEVEEEKIEILNQSIMNNWKGIFELKEKRFASGKQKTEDFYDDMKEWVSEHECN
ncbi:hypothetical protein [Velocimicrobium porci]|uniref:DnaD domain protein n=1 Tax=Velocimicrobium porci TaxID=2606634 RepID=A0A6L5Y0B7_9FIRM|nr:hypothetical protein [Velocimicrobium porci]MSS64576.1 hypothetical protein [Velocimicrobium porci]